nr:hypothetical protein [Tanacetum cinerariifolium]
MAPLCFPTIDFRLNNHFEVCYLSIRVNLVRPMRVKDCDHGIEGKRTWGGRGVIWYCFGVARCTGRGVGEVGFWRETMLRGTVWVVGVWGCGNFGPPAKLRRIHNQPDPPYPTPIDPNPTSSPRTTTTFTVVHHHQHHHPHSTPLKSSHQRIHHTSSSPPPCYNVTTSSPSTAIESTPPSHPHRHQPPQGENDTLAIRVKLDFDPRVEIYGMKSRLIKWL